MAKNMRIETTVRFKEFTGNMKNSADRRGFANRIQREGNKYRTKLKKRGTVMARIAVFLDSWVLRNFKSEGGSVGGWKALKAGGRRGPKGFDTNAKILQDSGLLRASFHPFFTSNNAGIGSDVPYAKKHEDGEGSLPVRRMLPKRRDVWPKVKKMLNSFVSKVTKS